ncbi:MAG: prepilin peptidase [bacterium]|nr:prepilin peptidase [bacterium]
MMASLLLVLFGLALGSWLNVVTLRYRPERRLFSFHDAAGRSHCLACGRELRWYELVPLFSFVFQLGRCRSCGVRLSFQYPLVELLGAAILAGAPRLIAATYSVSWGAVEALAAPAWYYALSALWIVAAFVWVAIGIVDLRHSIIPNGASVALAVLGGGVTVVLAGAALPSFQTSFLGSYALIAGIPANVFAGHILGAAAGGLVFWLLWALSRGRAMGFGDVKLAAASGLLLGWPDIALAVACSFIVGGVWGAALLATNRRSMGDRIPFGPFFVVGALLTVVFGRQFLAWYFGIFPGT